MLAHIGTFQLTQVFPDRDIFHFRRNNALFGIVHLGHILAKFSPAWFLDMGKADIGSTDIAQTLATKLRT